MFNIPLLILDVSSSLISTWDLAGDCTVDVWFGLDTGVFISIIIKIGILKIIKPVKCESRLALAEFYREIKSISQLTKYFLQFSICLSYYYCKFSSKKN